MTKQERQEAYQNMAKLMIENPSLTKNTWYAVSEYYTKYYHCSLDYVARSKEKKLPCISTVERWYRKILENNPWIKKRGDETDYKQIALDMVLVEKDGQVKIL